MLRYVSVLLFFLVSYCGFSQNLVLSDVEYIETNDGLVFDLEILNNSEVEDTLTSVSFYVVPNFYSSFYVFDEIIIFEPHEIKILTPDVCLKYDIGTFYTIIELPFNETPLNSVSFNVTNINSDCEDLNSDGFCDICRYFEDLPPISSLETVLNVELLTNYDFLERNMIEKVEFYNLLGQKIDNFDENGVKIVIIYYKNGFIGRIKII